MDCDIIDEAQFFRNKKIRTIVSLPNVSNYNKQVSFNARILFVIVIRRK